MHACIYGLEPVGAWRDDPSKFSKKLQAES
jgi:hypothetical protein